MEQMMAKLLKRSEILGIDTKDPITKAEELA